VDQYGSLLNALRRHEPTVYGAEADIFVSDVDGIDRATVRRVVEAIISLELGATELVERSPREAGELVASQVTDADGQALADAEAPLLSQRVAEILEITALRISVRALGLAVSNERNLLSSRVVTDIRPVFDDSKSTLASRILFLHRLHLHCTHGELHEELSITIDRTDLQSLIDQLTRAKDKEAAMREALKPAGFSVLDPPLDRTKS